MINIACGLYTLFLTYKRYVRNNGFDKYEAEFFKRNGIMSKEDIFMGMYIFTGVINLMTLLTVSDIFKKITYSFTGFLFLTSAGIIYIAKHQE